MGSEVILGSGDLNGVFMGSILGSGASIWGQGFSIGVRALNGVFMGSRVQYWGRGPKWGLYGVKSSILGSGSAIWGQGFNFGVRGS